MAERITLNVNGESQTITADPDMPLLYALRNDLGLSNPHFGCGLAPRGAAGPATRPVVVAIANAIFDATGVRLRRAPLSPENVKAALG